MFSIIADLLSSVITILFPIFASYKALRTSDPAQLTPWLMYWVVLSCAHLVESWTEWILVWIPFYSWIRLIIHAYLVLPQTQGARLLYQDHIHPFLASYESEIDNFITSAHDRAKAAGFQYLKYLITYVKENIFGLPPKAYPSPPPSAYGNSYVNNLFGRFNLPSAREGLAAPAGDFYGLLTAAMTHTGAGGQSREMQAEEMSASGLLIPKGIEGDEERMSFISTQRSRLQVLLQALDREASSISTGSRSVEEEDVAEQRKAVPTYGGGGMTKSRSELEFEQVEHDEAGGTARKDAVSGGWMPWNWSAKSTAKGSPSKTEREGATTSGTDYHQ